MTSQERLRNFIKEHSPGNCKVLSKGYACECPLCDLDRIVSELHWYGDYAAAIANDLSHPTGKKTDAVMASVTVLSLDAGKRSKI